MLQKKPQKKKMRLINTLKEHSPWFHLNYTITTANRMLSSVIYCYCMQLLPFADDLRSAEGTRILWIQLNSSLVVVHLKTNILCQEIHTTMMSFVNFLFLSFLLACILLLLIWTFNSYIKFLTWFVILYTYTHALLSLSLFLSLHGSILFVCTLYVY